MATIAKTTTTEEKKIHVHEVLADLTTVMMITAGTGFLTDATARPLSIAKLDEDSTLHFLTSVGTEKVKQATRNETGMITGQSKTQYVSLTGNYEVSNDPALIASLWSKAADVWFPKGKDDPTIRVITFRPNSAEIWDLSGFGGLRYALDLAKAWITKTPITGGTDIHTTVEL